uniref:Uncharacterized protein n=1 Tax=Chromera velia CCMP2878 TaxID=1169474 RepID=A0A0G4HD51_9ALVE|eukprot:Cvel_6329.t1-p1 / transcript=Cvel_6329.t1 / gene=Cvel_6329 / organism=Chromera_velia_CCMP2878 / gene_product=hypothetical protein / transcript_product=hypothetical protein / location=Cvel_scaffold307:42849-44840(-) / protein_length=664 / sequence_SO=supercontig / SO=protein_coding / is_pseudo=false
MKSEGGEWNFSGLAALFSHQFPALQELDMSGNNLQGNSDSDSAAPMIAEAVGGGRLPSVRTLMLNDTEMREADITVVFTALTEESAPHFEVLRLPTLNTPGSQALASALDSGHLSELREMTLCACNSVASESEGLGVVMRSVANDKAPSLNTLKIAVRDSEEGEVDQILGALAERLREGRVGALADLDLEFRMGNEGIGPGPLIEFGRALGAGGCSSLRKLSLYWVEEGDEGVGALAEGLGSGSLVSLEELSLKVSYGAGEGSRALGEVLSKGKVSSLRKLLLDSDLGSGLQALAEGFGVGSLSPHLIVDLCLFPVIFEDDEGLTTAAVRAVAALIRERKVSGLRKVEVKDYDRVIEGEAAYDLGAALTGGGGRVGAPVVSLQSFEELEVGPAGFVSETGLSGLFRGIASGRGSLPSLHTISVPYLFPCDVSAARPLAECITKGKLPRLRNLCLSLVASTSLGQEGMHALSLALCSPHAKSLRSLTLRSEETGNDRKAVAAEVAQMSALSVSFSLGQLTALEELSLGGALFPESVSALCVGLGSGTLRSLRSLELPHVGLDDDEAASALSQALSAEKLPELRSLTLHKVTDAGFKKLTAEWVNSTPPPLEILDMSRSAVLDEGVLALVSLSQTGRLPFLRSVRVGNRVSRNVRATMKGVFPHSD